MRTRWVVPAVFGLLLTIALGFAGTAALASITKGPYLQSMTETTLIVHWETSASQPGKVQYGLTGAFGSEASQSGSSVQHEIQLTGLLPDTLYYYRSISGSDTSASAIFHMPVRPGRSFRFLVYGDNRTNAAAHQSVVHQMNLANPPGALVVDTGDLTETASTGDYQTFFNIVDEVASHEPFYPCVGNHDTANMTNWYNYFSLPNNERWYTFRYGSVVLHNLDIYSPYTPGNSQYNWFVNELKADSADATIRHIIVSFHEPPYTTNTGHSSNLTVRQYICPLLERYHVKLSFQGHNHCYEHSLVNGVHYLISGGGGAPLYTGWGAAQTWTVYREATYEFVQIDVRGDTLAVKTVKPGGAVIDPFTVVAEPSAVGGGPAIPPSLVLRIEPNPASQEVRLSFSLPRAGYANLAVYDPAGRRVALLADRNMHAGEHAYTLATGELPAGVYFAALRTPEGSLTRQLVVLR